MADFTQISVSEDQLQAEPGSDVSTTISIRNSGNVVDVFTIEIAGLDESWVDLSVSSVSLFPGDQSTSELKITVPRDGTALAQKYPFTVKVASRKDPAQTVDVECTLDVGAYYEFQATMDPPQATGGSGKYSVLLSNTSNAELSVTLEGNDPQGNSSFTFSQRTARIAPGGTQTVTVTVVANNRPLRGRPHSRGFSVQASPSQGTAAPVTITGRLEVPPRLPRWAIPAGIGAFVGLVALIALVVILTRGGDIPVPVVTPSSIQEAREALTARGFVVENIAYLPSDDVAQDKVIGTVPPDGSEVEKGTGVTLLVSSGPASWRTLRWEIIEGRPIIDPTGKYWEKYEHDENLPGLYLPLKDVDSIVDTFGDYFEIMSDNNSVNTFEMSEGNNKFTGSWQSDANEIILNLD